MRVAILWHMHQPSYWDSRLKRYRYPWAFLHAARHYHMMAHRSSLHPQMRLTFNITPVLIEQLEYYATQETPDVLLEVVLRPAADLGEDELRRLLDHVFKLNLRTMVDPFPRYRELHGLLGGPLSSAKLRRLKPQEVRDLQTLYLLTWCGAPLRDREPVKQLLEKERDYTEDDKRAVYGAARAALRETLPLYRRLQDEGVAEFSTTPYFHPILPLVIDCEAARQSRHDVHLEEVDFRFGADAEWQVEAAIRAHRERFGADPVGMWPAEGGVSEAALAIMAEKGVRWAATDEGILARSFGRGLSAEEKHKPYRLGDGRILVYFRDRELSDRIGFVYSGWDPVAAADDLMGRLQGIRDHLGGAAHGACVTIILDGENPWEHYPDSGIGFLDRLYSQLPRTQGLEPVRFQDGLEAGSKGSLGRLVPGSWIDANFDTWIGGPEKNHAWRILSAARKKAALDAPGAKLPLQFYRAEGSDWFWWLGPGHDTPYESSYENLFRLNLEEGLRELGLEAPPVLKATAPILPSPVFQPPMHLFTPRIEGSMRGYYDWIAAGFYRSSEGSFHRTGRRFSRLRFGFDARCLYVRMEGEDLERLKQEAGARAVLEVRRPRALEVVFAGGEVAIREGEELVASGGARGAWGVVVELAVPLEVLGARPGDVVEFAAGLQAGKDALDRLPQFGFVALAVPGPEYGQENWSV